ncbi:MAG: WecB/TagA/CpsF family glycosyltransferase [Pseudomonadota bacterium]
MSQNTTWTPIDHVIIGGVRAAVASRQTLSDAMVADCRARMSAGGRARIIADVNGHGLSLYATDKAFRQDLDAADVVHADGAFITVVSRYFCDATIPERSATTDMIHDAAVAAIDAGLSFYLLGATADVNRRCRQELERLYPKLRIAGARDGFFSEAEEGAVVDEINRSGADIVWVGLGKPKEQAFAIRWRERFSAGWVITCGGCFNYITGDYTRAPVWMQNAGLEWLHRMLTKPKALFWRYLTTTPHALYLIARHTRRQVLPG